MVIIKSSKIKYAGKTIFSTILLSTSYWRDIYVTHNGVQSLVVTTNSQRLIIKNTPLTQGYDEHACNFMI